MNKNMEYCLVNVNIVDVNNDKLLKERVVHIKDGKIQGFKEVQGVKIIDCNNGFLVPGLINMHVHLFSSGKPSNTVNGKGDSQAKLMKFIKTPLGDLVLNMIVKGKLKTTILSGTTTVRSVGDINFSDCKQRDAIKNGKYIGPNVVCSGQAISVPGGHAVGTITRSATTKEEFEALVEDAKNHNCDWIKTMITSGVMDAKSEGVDLMMNVENTKWVCNKAHKLGYRVASHIESTEGVKVALKGGVDTIEHGGVLDDECVELFKKNNSALITTISPAITYSEFPDSETHCTKTQKNCSIAVANGIIEASKRALKEGITVGLGTDASCPYAFHYGMWRELAYFKKYVGVTNEFALKTGTIINAKILKMDDKIGSIDVNKDADLMLVSSNPYDDLKALRDPKMVIKGGAIIKNPKIKRFNDFETKLDKLTF